MAELEESVNNENDLTANYDEEILKTLNDLLLFFEEKEQQELEKIKAEEENAVLLAEEEQVQAEKEAEEKELFFKQQEEIIESLKTMNQTGDNSVLTEQIIILNENMEQFNKANVEGHWIVAFTIVFTLSVKLFFNQISKW